MTVLALCQSRFWFWPCEPVLVATASKFGLSCGTLQKLSDKFLEWTVAGGMDGARHSSWIKTSLTIMCSTAGFAKQAEVIDKWKQGLSTSSMGAPQCRSWHAFVFIFSLALAGSATAWQDTYGGNCSTGRAQNPN